MAWRGFDKTARIQGLAVDPARLSNCPGMISNRVNEYTEFKNGKD
jgi:hypothetical protein